MSIKHLLLTLCGVFCLPLAAGAATDTTAPTVTDVTPVTATKNVAVTISATYHDDSAGVASCTLFVDSIAQGVGIMNLSVPTGRDGVASQSYTYTGSGSSFSVRISCTDQATSPNTGNSALTTVTVTSPGTVGSVSPTTATVNVATSFSAPYSGFTAPNTAAGCWLVVDGVTQYPGGTLSGGAGSTNGTASKTYTFTTTGNHSVFMSCLQNEGTYIYGTPTTINVITAPAGDTAAPTVGQVVSITPTQGTPATISAAYSDNVAVASCTLYVNGTNWGTMNGASGASGTASKDFTFSSSGAHTVYVTCADAAGNVGTGATRTVTVSATPAPAGDTSPPVVGNIWESSATVGSSLTLHANAYDNVGIVHCDLYVNGAWRSSMSVSGGANPTVNYTFPSAGTYTAYAQCRDLAGNTTNGPSQTITVAAASFPIPPTTPGSGRLVKAACPAYVGADHPCKAVYYYGSDGKRHAFPNERVFFTWYTDFNTVDEVSDAYLASIPLGLNVTYRPGTRLVKFTTVNRVYAISRRGVLRWVTTEGIANALYGPSWNRMVDDIPDAFYTNYTFGADITSTSQYSPSGETAATYTIDANF